MYRQEASPLQMDQRKLPEKEGARRGECCYYLEAVLLSTSEAGFPVSFGGLLSGCNNHTS